jgi:hypothetical protein
MSRREALAKGALAGAAGLAAVAVARPTPVEAAYFLQGDAVHAAHSATSLIAQSSYATGSFVLRADASPTNNSTQAIDALQAQGAGIANGLRAWGGQLNGPGVYSQGGGSTGPGLVALAGGGTYSAAFQGEGVVAQGKGSGAGVSATGFAGIQARGTGGSFPVIYGGTGLHAAGGVTGGGYGYGIYATGAGSPAPTATPAQTAAVVALGGAFAGVFGAIGAPGLYAAGGPSTGQIQLAPASSAGPPPGDTSQKGEVWTDSNGTLWICTVSAVYDINGLVSPGVWEPLLQGGLNNALFTAVSTQQYTLANSNGLIWVDLDATNLKLAITPSFTCHAILSGNSDLWTSSAGFNQDLGITISGGAYPTVAGQPEAWKESGGFAGTFSPNAASVETVRPLVAGTTYIIKLQWKANKNAPGATIWAGAGPIPMGSSTFSPTRLTALLIVSQ